MKFINLLKKELHELLTPQVFIGMIASVALLIIMGDAMGSFIDDSTKDFGKVTICNQDDTEFTQAVISAIELSNTEVAIVDINSDDYSAELQRLDLKSIVIIPEGFSESVLNGEAGELKTVSQLTSLSSMASLSSEATHNAVSIIEMAVRSTLYIKHELSNDDIIQLEEPLTLSEVTVVGSKSADISLSVVQSLTSSQGMFIPIVIFVLVIYASQMIMAAISTEKIDKTLETLLSAPVSRLAVLASKMTAAGIVAALNAVAYMFGFNKMMDNMMGNISSSNPETSAIIADLGLKLAKYDYLLLGLQMFLTILIALSIALMLGAMAKDAKAAQTLLMPIMFMAMIPYFVSMIADVKTLPVVLRILLYAIPFTHTFTAMENIMLDNMPIFWFGVLYQTVLLAVCMFLAVRLIMTDRIFTMTIDFSKKKSRKDKKGLFSSLTK